MQSFKNVDSQFGLNVARELFYIYNELKKGRKVVKWDKNTLFYGLDLPGGFFRENVCNLRFA